MTKEPRLKFTDKELAENSPVGTAARKAKKAAEKADKVQAKIPRRKQPKIALRFEDDAEPSPKDKPLSSQGRERSAPEKQKALKRAVQEPVGKKSVPNSKSVLRFEQQEKKPPKHPNAYARDAPRNAVRQAIQENTQEQDENENVGVEATQTAEEIEHRAEGVLHEVHYSAEMRPYRGAQKAEEKLEKANLDYLQKKAQAEHPTSNPVSRWRQKQEIKRQYAAAKAGRTAQTANNTAEAASTVVTSTVEKIKEFGSQLFQNKKLWAVILAIMLGLSFFLNVMSSCSVIVEGVGSVLAGSTYPASDDTLLGAEAMYKAKEDELRLYLNTYESTHDYDEYHFDLDEISHDPYVLSSFLSALDPNGLSVGAVAEIISRLFDQQYILTEDVTTETRYKSETKTDWQYVYNPDTGSYEWQSYTYTEQVPYDYTICNVRLENKDLSHLPVDILTESQLQMYATYMATLGNRPDLFPESPYKDLYTNKDGLSFELPPEALSDERAAAMIKEAQKYLGYPYVWGGSSPSTSFDCSGYVCWVVNHSGGNIGRLSAQGICNICTPISASNVKPGDLVFFKGTYNTPGVSHCGIYVGNNTMIHCGDPIKYANLNTTYWQSHFYTFGRLP